MSEAGEWAKEGKDEEGISSVASFSFSLPTADDTSFLTMYASNYYIHAIIQDEVEGERDKEHKKKKSSEIARHSPNPPSASEACLGANARGIARAREESSSFSLLVSFFLAYLFCVFQTIIPSI